MIRNRMKQWLHITTAMSLIWQQITPVYATMQTQDPTDEVKTRASVSVPLNPNNNNTTDPFKGALSAFKTLRANHPGLQNLKENEPTCFISYARGIPEHEKLIEILTENLKEAGINLLSRPKINIEDNKNGTTTYQFAGNVQGTPVNFVLVAGSKKLMERYESRDISSVRLELEMLTQKTPGFSPTLLPIVLESDPKDVLPQFLLNTAAIVFQDPTAYPANCLNLLARLYRLDAQDPYLQAIEAHFKEGKVIDDVKGLLTVSPLSSLSSVQAVTQPSNVAVAVQITSNTNTPTDPFRAALLLFKNLRTAHPQLYSLKDLEPSCFISYIKGVPEQEKLIHTLAGHLKEAGIHVLIDIWNNENETPAFQFAENILDDKTDFVVLTGAKRLMELYNTKGTSPIKLELGMIAQRATGLSHTILPILLDGFHKEALPRFLWNTVSIGFQDSAHYPASCFNLLARLYRLDSQDPYLQAIESNFKAGKVMSDVKELVKASLTPSLSDADLAKNPFSHALHSFKVLRTQHPKLKTLDANRPTAFLSYSWGSPRNEKIVHLMAEHLRDAGINVMLDIWHNTGGTGITQFAEKILDAKTDFVVLNGTKKLIEKYTSQAYSVVKMELGMIAQRATGASQTIIPLLLEDDYKNVLPKFLWNNARIDFKNFETYHVSLFNLLGRLYQLDSHDPALQDIMTNFKKKKEQGEPIESIADILNALPLTMDPKVETHLKAAKLGDMVAQFELAMRYDEGQGVEQNAKKATKWYLEAAQQGHAQAQFNLGLRYDTGHGVEQNDTEAFKWYKASADQGNASAQCNIGQMYEQGRGVNKDEQEAIKYYQLSAAQGHMDAKNNLGKMYEEGRGGLEKNEKEAASLYRAAAEKNNADAQNNLGRLYEEGRGIDSNQEEAIGLYTRAAEQGHHKAQDNLKRIADQGNAGAQYNVGDMYGHARGVGQDDREAVKWYLRAAKQNHTEAQAKLGVILQTLTDLNLESSNLGNEGAKVLAKALEGNDSIMNLDIRDNGVGDEGALAIIQSLKGRKGVKVKGLDKFENVLECMQNQTPSLNLSGAGLTDKGIGTFVSLLASLPHLQGLDFSDNELTAEGISSLGRALAIHAPLQQLTLSKSYIGDERALAFLQSFKGRKGIKIKGLGKLENLLDYMQCQTSSLDLSGAGLTAKGAKVLTSLLAPLPNLQQFSLSDNSIRSEGAKTLVEWLKGQTSLTMLDLSYNSIGDEGITAIGEVLKGNTSLTALNFSGNVIGIEGAKALGEGLKGNASLKELNLASSRIGGEGARVIGEVLKSNTTLTTLVLSGNNLRAEGAKAIGDGLKGNTTLTTLDLYDNSIENEGARVIGEVLKSNTTLTTLHLKYNSIGDEGAKSLGEGLESNDSLMTLDLESNYVGVEGTLMLIQGIKGRKAIKIKGLGRLEKLLECMQNQASSLDLSDAMLKDKGVEILASLLASLPYLQQLNLSDNSIKSEGAKSLGEVLKGNTSLTALNLSGNVIGIEGAKSLGEGLKSNTSLKDLNLDRNRIGTEGAKAIGEGLKENTSLVTLHLSGNVIGTESVKALGEGLKVNTSLTTLNLQSNIIRDEGARVLAAVLEAENHTLTCLNLGNVSWAENKNNISEEGKKAFQDLMQRKSLLTVTF